MQGWHSSNTTLFKRTIFLLALALFLISFATSCAKIRYANWYNDYGVKGSELNDPSSAPKLLKALDNDVLSIRILAFQLLADKHPDALTVPVLSNLLLNNEDARIRVSVLKFLSQKGPEAIDAGPAIEAVLMDINPGVRLHAIIAIQKINYVNNNVLESLKIVASYDSHPKVRQRAQSAAQSISLSLRSQNDKAKATLTDKSTSITANQKDGIYSVPNFYSIPRNNDLAVIIGIETYQNIDKKSDYSLNDAQLVKEYLRALGFQERNIEFLTNERATGNGIKKSLEAWLPNHVKKSSRVFIYYSGHGSPDSKGNGYIVPYDGDPAYLSVTGYPLNKLYANLEKLDASEIIVIMDSCFSGTGGKSVLADGTRPMSIEVSNPISLSDKIAILTSSHMNQISTSYPDKELGLLTYYVLKALKDGKMTLSEIYKYIKPMVEDEAKKMNIEQSPQLLPQVSKSDRVFSLR